MTDAPVTSATRPLLELKTVTMRFGGVVAVNAVDFTIYEGEIFALIGPNGAGKTTALECVIGLREPDGGEIEVCGIDARRHPRDVKQKIGAALQTTALQDKITPREALALFGALYRRSASPRDLLKRFALDDKADVSFDSLSGGQRQRLALALAFVNNPELVFLDEPTAGLDPQARRELHAEIARMKRDGHTVLLTTHYIDEAEQLCDRIAIIDDGRIVATGTPHALVAGSKATPSVSLTVDRPVDSGLLAGVPGLEAVECNGVGIRLRASNVTRAIADVMTRLDAHGVGLVDLQVRKATLEDVFLELTGTRLRD
jgi:ABC-2 type transport system ATP-binding protein